MWLGRENEQTEIKVWLNTSSQDWKVRMGGAQMIGPIWKYLHGSNVTL